MIKNQDLTQSPQSVPAFRPPSVDTSEDG